MFLTGCRFQRNWRIERPGWRNLLRPVTKSKPVPRNASSGSRLSIRGSWREGKGEATGRKPRSKPPEPPVEGPLPTDQINLTDEESRIMPVAGGGFEQGYNAQAVVAAGSLLVVAAEVVQAANDKQQLQPMLNKLAVLPDALGDVETLRADSGYYSAANVTACAAAGIDPLVAMDRQPHHPSLDERFAPVPPARENPTPV